MKPLDGTHPYASRALEPNERLNPSEVQHCNGLGNLRCCLHYLELLVCDEAKQILREASACARAVIVSVPSLNYPRCNLGDERLLSPASWREILREFKPKVRYYVLDFQSIKNSLLAKRIPKPWHILIKIRP
jgi:hypothetical protein